MTNSAFNVTGTGTGHKLILTCNECGHEERFNRDLPAELIEPVLVAHYRSHIVAQAMQKGQARL